LNNSTPFYGTPSRLPNARYADIGITGIMPISGLCRGDALLPVKQGFAGAPYRHNPSGSGMANSLRIGRHRPVARRPLFFQVVMIPSCFLNEKHDTSAVHAGGFDGHAVASAEPRIMPCDDG
jgi:hypothetical protein